MNGSITVPGISFLVKVHNEETTLEASVRSLFGLLITYEIIIILHLCTDASRAIVTQLYREAPHLIRIYTYNETVARPGYETLVTDATSLHSLPTYYNWALQHRRYLWTAKWDADFVAPASLRTYLNSADIWHLPNQLIWLPARAASHDEYHPYFSSCLSRYMKQVFYEVPMFEIQPPTHVRHTPPVYIQHLSPITLLKPYWHQPAWFTQEETAEASLASERYARLVAEFGAPPLGMGRSGDTEISQQLGQRIIDAWPSYVSFTD
jgi:hypothetical protein